MAENIKNYYKQKAKNKNKPKRKEIKNYVTIEEYIIASRKNTKARCRVK